MKFENILANDKVKEFLNNSIENNKVLHSYLFLGTEGIGKKEIAKEFARKILCLNDHSDECKCKACLCFENDNHPDFNLINDQGETIKINQIREITNKIYEKPIISSKKVYIINDCEKMTEEAQNCLLKTLEEPPEYVCIILISSNENFILTTIKSRCMKISFKNISDEELKNYLLKNNYYDTITNSLLKLFNGSIGMAIKMQENQDLYQKVENIIKNIENQDLIDILLNYKDTCDKENIFNILEYMSVCFFEMAKEDKRYIECINKVNNTVERLKSNGNFDMTLDNLFIGLWEEINQ